MEKLRLQNARSFAISRKDAAEVEKIDAQLNQLLANAEHNGSYSKTRKDEAVTAIIERVNERNRKANLEQVRKAEQVESERKRRERKLAASANGTATPPVRRYKGMLDSRFVTLLNLSRLSCVSFILTFVWCSLACLRYLQAWYPRNPRNTVKDSPCDPSISLASASFRNQGLEHSGSGRELRSLRPRFSRD